MTHGSASGWRSVLPYFKWPLALIVLAVLIHLNRNGFQELGKHPIQWHFLALGSGLCLCSVVLTFLRWHLLVWAQGFGLRFSESLRIGFLGYLFNYIAQGSIGGDVVKGAMLVRRTKERRLIAASTVILDRMLGLVSLLLVGAGASFFAPEDIEDRAIINKVVWIGSSIGIGILAIILHPVSSKSRLVKLISRLPKVGAFIGDLAESAAMYQSRRGVIVAGILIGILGQFGVISSFYFCALAIGDPTEIPPYTSHILLIPLAELIGYVSPTPGGLGGLEYAVKRSYELAGSSGQLGLIAAGAYRVTSICIAFIGGIYYFLGRDEIRRVLQEDTTTDDADKPAS